MLLFFRVSLRDGVVAFSTDIIVEKDSLRVDRVILSREFRSRRSSNRLHLPCRNMLAPIIPLHMRVFIPILRQSGTLVHYYENETDAPGPPEVIPLPSSSTGRMAHISIETLKLAARIRSTGARLVLVSGTRYSTFVDRLPYLPRADAYVIENGGRIFYPREQPLESTGLGEVEARGGLPAEFASLTGDPKLTAHPASALSEDLKWREELESVTGPATEDAKSPEERKGPLWDLYRRAVADGFEVDTKAYFTMFRIKIKGCKKGQSGGGSEGEEDAVRAVGEGRDGVRGGEGATKRLLESLPPGLGVVTNFGLVDICPERSGKHNAAAYLAREHFGISLDRCASMGDDDNDIALVRRESAVSLLFSFPESCSTLFSPLSLPASLKWKPWSSTFGPLPLLSNFDILCDKIWDISKAHLFDPSYIDLWDLDIVCRCLHSIPFL